MGNINFSGPQFVGTTTETIGYKSGIALTIEQAADLSPKQHKDLWHRGWVRMRAEEYDELIVALLYAVGNIPVPTVMPGTIALHHKYKRDPAAHAVYEQVVKLLD